MDTNGRRIVAVIPSRYASSRLPGKGIADINGKPMIWWVYQQCIKCRCLDDIVVAIDDERTKDVCKAHGIKYLMTSKDCNSHILRIWEVSEETDADIYIEVCGDEPMIEPGAIEDVVKAAEEFNAKDYGVVQSYTDLTDPVSAYDCTINKMVTDMKGDVIYFSRSPIPYPKGKRDFVLKKGVGIHAFTKRSLDFLHDHPVRGPLERIEEIDELRYIEYGHRVKAVHVESSSISVDTPKDLEYVRKVLSN